MPFLLENNRRMKRFSFAALSTRQKEKKEDKDINNHATTTSSSGTNHEVMVEEHSGATSSTTVTTMTTTEEEKNPCSCPCACPCPCSSADPALSLSNGTTNHTNDCLMIYTVEEDEEAAAAASRELDDHDAVNGGGEDDDYDGDHPKQQHHQQRRRSTILVVDKEDVTRFLFTTMRRGFPRTYFITVQLILPLCGLIAMAFLFGCALAKLEMPGEIHTNNDLTANVFKQYIQYRINQQKIWNAVQNAPGNCLAQLQPTVIPYHNNNTVTNTLLQCARTQAMEKFPIEDIVAYVLNKELPPLTFNWMMCPLNTSLTVDEFRSKGLNYLDLHDQLLYSYVQRFYDGFKNRLLSAEERIPFPIPSTYFLEDDSTEYLVELAGQSDGSHGCTIHKAAGFLFWFTIMTTIGYGNTAPRTDEGRILVMTLGFMTIIGFVGLNNTASNVWMCLLEDLFLRYNIQCLCRGPFSVLFWFTLTVLWLLILAASMVRYQENNTGNEFPLKDAFWFSFITTTTVGFGDIHFEHEEFAIGDMFFIPFIVLISFNFLQVFAQKLCDLYNDYFPDDCGFQQILQQNREAAKEEQERRHTTVTTTTATTTAVPS